MQLDLSFASPVDRRSVYASEGRRRAFALLSEGFGAGPGFLLLTGAPGTGKTLLLADALTSWSEGVPLAWLTASSLNRDPLAEIALRFGIPADGAQEPGTAFERFLAGVGARGERALLAVDDAHELSGDALDTLILLAEFEHEGRRPLHVLLVGRTELDERVAGPECDALRERIAVQCRLDPLAEQETERYLRLRVANGSGAASAPSRAISLVIHALGAGNPRAIDRLVDEAMRRYAVTSPGGLSEAQLRASAAFLAGQEPPAEVAAEAERSAPESDASAAPATAGPGRPMADVGPARGIGASSHAEVKEWVSRFVGEQGPPKIGARLAFDAIEAEVNRHEQRMAVLEFSPRPAVEGSDDAVNGTAAGEAPAEELAELPLPARRPAPQRASSRSRRGKPRMVPYTIAAVLGLLLAAILLLPRVRTLLPSLGAKPAVQDSTPSPARSTSSQGLGAPAGSASTSPAIVLTPSKPSAVVAPADTAKPVPVWRGLEVATYLSADRAHEEQQRLSSLTGLSGQVLTGTEDGADVFRVVLGQYRSRSRAEKAAAWLLNDGYVTQARTIRIEPPPNIE